MGLVRAGLGDFMSGRHSHLVRRRITLKVPLWVLLLAVAISALRQENTEVGLHGLACIILAVLAAVVIGACLEASLFESMRPRAKRWRLLVGIFAGPGFLVVGVTATIVSALLLGVVGLSERAWLLPAALVVATIWMISAAAGSLIVLVLDLLISAILLDFRSRFLVAILSLLGLIAGTAALLQGMGTRLVEALTTEESLAGFLEFGDLASRGETVSLLAKEAVADLVGITFLFVVVVFSLPAIVSAASKLADGVMERLDPLSDAFRTVGEGDLSVRVEAGGSREFVHLAERFNAMVEDLALGRNIERAFGLYVSEQVLDRIRSQQGDAKLPASSREATVLFADIRGFTSMSESRSPEKVLDILNQYFERVVPVIDRFSGYLDKFVGDAVVVVFNGPIDQAEHALLGARCACAMQEAIAELNQDGSLQGVNRLDVGIGIATGLMVAGNLGGSSQMEYTVIGDTVNLAARLSGATPAGEIWANQTTAEAVEEEFNAAAIPPLEIRGKADPVVAFRIGKAT